MPKKSIPLRVIKIPYEGTKSVFPKSFPRLSRLYLELIENQKKLKPEFIGKEFVVDYSLIQKPAVSDLPIPMKEPERRLPPIFDTGARSPPSYASSPSIVPSSPMPSVSSMSSGESISSGEDREEDDLTQKLKKLLVIMGQELSGVQHKQIETTSPTTKRVENCTT